MFFIATYIHMLRGLYYGSYKAPREVIWLLGSILFFLLIATAFLGYVLPWGQMSFHGAVVITNLLGAIPVVGESITTWLWGGFAVDNPTLNRFFALHYLLPFIIAGIVGLHIWALHVPGNNNPVGILIPQDLQRRDTLPFHPYYTVKDGFAIVLFLILFSVFVFFNPNALGHADNYIPANPLVTPAHIVPEWYLLPFYAILRAVPDKFGGVLLMFGAIVVIFLLPWLDTSKVRSTRYRPTAKIFFWIFLVTCLILGWCGAQLPDDMVFSVGERADGSAIGLNYVWLTRIVTAMYFAYFLIVLPLLGLIEKPLPIPPSISAPVLSHAGGDGGDGGAYVGHNPAPATGGPFAGRPATAKPETRG
jgi:ubiquinol-cytochrome c reductase cytochrome b subunit